MTLLENILINLSDLDYLVICKSYRDEEWRDKATKLIKDIFIELQEVRKVYEADRSEAVMEGFERATKIINEHLN